MRRRHMQLRVEQCDAAGIREVGGATGLGGGMVRRYVRDELLEAQKAMQSALDAMSTA